MNLQINADNEKHLKNLLKKKDENIAHVKKWRKKHHKLQDVNALLQEKCNITRKQEKTQR